MTRFLWLLTGTLVCAFAGCNLFPHFNGSQTEKVDKEPFSLARGMLTSIPCPFAFQFVFLSDIELRRDLPIFKDLSNLREQVYHELHLPPSSTDISVYMFENKERFEEFIHKNHPNLPPRRAFFVAQARRMGGVQDLMVYTYWGERIQQDLRHELTHAMLHSTLKGVPIWLDEGLAEYFEVPASQNGVNQKHLEPLRPGRHSL